MRTTAFDKLDVRAVLLYSRNVDMRSLPPEKHAEDRESGIAMAHYDRITVQHIPTIGREHGRDTLESSPLAQAYLDTFEVLRSKKAPQQEILAFADVANEQEQKKLDAFWKDDSEPLLFVTLVNLCPEANLAEVKRKIQDKFLDKTVVYATFDYNDLVIFHRGNGFSEYVQDIFELDYAQTEPSNKSRKSLISDSITLYSFSENFTGEAPDEETFDAYLRMGIANTQMMEAFYDKLKELPQYGQTLQVNYILGRHDVGFYQPKATLKWIQGVRKSIQEISQELAIQIKSNKEMDTILNETQLDPIWYTTSTLSIRIVPQHDLEKMGNLIWSGTHYERNLRKRVDAAYEEFQKAYINACNECKVTDDIAWLDWLKKGYQQAILFWESDLMHELGVCLVPLYLDFLDYEQKLWTRLSEEGNRWQACLANDLQERVSPLVSNYRKRAEQGFMDLFQNVSILIDSMNHSSRQFIQTPPFRTMAFSIPPKLMAYYTAVGHQILLALQDDPSNHYGFMIAPSFVRNLEVISIAVKELTGKDQMLSIAVSEPALYSLQQTTFYLAHEFSHYLGQKNRMRVEREGYLLKACIHNFLWYALGDFLEKLNSNVRDILGESNVEGELDLDRGQVWEQLVELSADLWEKEKQNPRYENVEPYLVNDISRAEEMLEKIVFNLTMGDVVYQVFWDLIENKKGLQKAAAKYLIGEILSESEEAIETSKAVENLAWRKGREVFDEAIKNSFLAYVNGRPEHDAQIGLITDLFRETFADLQAVCLLNLSAKAYYDIFTLRNPNQADLEPLHRGRVLAVVSVLSNRGIETQNPEFEDLLRILRERSLQESDCIALLKTKLVNGVVEFYVHAYLQECKNTITTEFESNPKVQDLRNLYKRLGNDSTVVELMGTLKETVRSYRDTLCAKI